jgi:type VI protein secretion system component Hcp
MVTKLTRGIETGAGHSLRFHNHEPEIPLAKNVQKKPSRNPDDLVKPVSGQLEQSELEQVSGGKVTMSDFHFVKKVDKASPQ